MLSSKLRVGAQNYQNLPGAPEGYWVRSHEFSGGQRASRWVKRAPRSTQEASTTAQERSKTHKMPPRRPNKRPQYRSKRHHKRLQEANIIDGHCGVHCFSRCRVVGLPTPHNGPRGSKVRLKTASEAPKTAKERPKTARRHPRRPQGGRRGAQEEEHELTIRDSRPNNFPGGPKSPPRDPKSPPRGLNRLPKRPKK